MAQPIRSVRRALHHGLRPQTTRGLLALSTAFALSSGLPATAEGGVTITSYGHSALLIQGGGATVLLNPFKAVGCAAGC